MTDDDCVRWDAQPRPNGPGSGGRWSTLADQLDLEPWTPGNELEVVSGD